MTRLPGVIGLSFVCAGVVACSSDSRNEPPPAEMCRQLVEACVGLDTALTDDCYDVGERGLDEPKHQDQCFVFYDGCIDECNFRAYWAMPEDVTSSSDGGDAGVPRAASDAGEADAAPADAAD